jgi:hypothetical protein
MMLINAYHDDQRWIGASPSESPWRGGEAYSINEMETKNSLSPAHFVSQAGPSHLDVCSCWRDLILMISLLSDQRWIGEGMKWGGWRDIACNCGTDEWRTFLFRRTAKNSIWHKCHIETEMPHWKRLANECFFTSFVIYNIWELVLIPCPDFRHRHTNLVYWSKHESAINSQKLSTWRCSRGWIPKVQRKLHLLR